jgi:hypothetical protein
MAPHGEREKGNDAGCRHLSLSHDGIFVGAGIHGLEHFHQILALGGELLHDVVIALQSNNAASPLTLPTQERTCRTFKNGGGSGGVTTTREDEAKGRARAETSVSSERSSLREEQKKRQNMGALAAQDRQCISAEAQREPR